MILFHYTCTFCAYRIHHDGRIHARPQAALSGMPVVWLGDYRLRSPNIRQRLGIGYHANDPDRPCCNEAPACDPTAVRFGVNVDIADHPYVHPYSRLARDFPKAAAMYRALPGATPWRWWFATADIKITGRIPTP